MKNPSFLAIKNKKITLFIAVSLILLGIYSYYVIPKQENPDLSFPVALITAVYPGASSEDMENLVTRKIEDELLDIEGFDYSESTSKEGLTVVFALFTRDVDLEDAWSKLRERMSALQGELPEGCETIQIDTDLMDTAGIIISMSGEGYTNRELNSYAELLKRELSKINGISKFEITGEVESDVKIEVDFKKLNYHNLSLKDLTEIIMIQNIGIPLGEIEGENNQIKVRATGAYESIDEIENTIIGVSESTGAILRLNDIARVYMDYDSFDYKIKHNSKDSVLLTGYFKNKENIVLVGKDVREVIEQIKEELPKDLVFEEILFQPKDVRDAVNSFAINLLQGILFVMIVVFIGMGLRNAVIVSTAIPMSIFITIIVMNISNIYVHQISIAALIIALGMLVDNAIVVSDAIQVRFDNGESRLDASVEGVKEVAIPILTSTLTTIGAFLPLLPLKSDAGEYIRAIPQIITISLLASYFVALFLTPTIAYLFFKKSDKQNKKYKLKEHINNLLTSAMHSKGKTALVVIGCIIIAIILSSFVNPEFFPKADKNIIYIDITSEKEDNINHTQRVVEEIESIIANEEEIYSYTSAIGGTLPKFYTTMMPGTEAKDAAQIMIRLDLEKGKRFKTNTEFSNYIQKTIDSKITGANVAVKELELAEPISYPIQVRVLGDDLDMLAVAAKEVNNILLSIDGTVDVGDDLNDKKLEYYVDIDERIASSLGISKYDIQNEINIALMGRAASVFRADGNEHDIIVKSNIASMEDLENLMIKSSITEKKHLLKGIANIRLEPQTTKIQKYDRQKSVLVHSDIIPGYNSVKIQEQLKERISKLQYDRVSIELDGENEQINENFGDVGISAIFAVLTIYCILLIQFNSFIQPLIILVTLPLSAIGSIIGLFIFRQPLSFTGLLGIVSLFGIVVNNAIVLIDYINSERKAGKDIETACIESVNRRLRPIILSTATTVIGLTPLALSGNDLFEPMAVSLMSGLIVSTLLTLIIVPLVYKAVEDKLGKINKLIYSKVIRKAEES